MLTFPKRPYYSHQGSSFYGCIGEMQLTWSVWIVKFPAAQNSSYSPSHYTGICFYSSQTQKLSKEVHRPLRGVIISAHALTKSLTGQKPTHKYRCKCFKHRRKESSITVSLTFYRAASCYGIGWEILKCLSWSGCENHFLVRSVFGIPLADLNTDLLHPH